MSSKILKREGNKLTLEIEMLLDPNSMLSSEEQIAESLSKAGLLASMEALKQFDTDGSAISINGEMLTSKGKSKKNTNFRGEVKK